MKEEFLKPAGHKELDDPVPGMVLYTAVVSHLTLSEAETLKIVDSSATRVRSGKQIYPNDPCPCGSGKKYKHCCGRKAAGSAGS